MVQYKNLPPEISRQVAAFLKQSQIATAMRASKMTKSDMSPALQQRQKQINEKYNDFFKTLMIPKAKPQERVEILIYLFLRELRDIVKTYNPNIVMKNGHTPLYNFVYTCVTSVYFKNPDIILHSGLRIFIENKVNVNLDEALFPYLLSHNILNHDITSLLCKEGVIIKEKDFATFLRKKPNPNSNPFVNLHFFDDKMSEGKEMITCIMKNHRNGTYAFNFNYMDRTEGIRLPDLIRRYILDRIKNERYCNTSEVNAYKNFIRQSIKDKK